MLRILARFIGLAAMAGGFAQLVVDGARSIAAAALVWTPLAETVAAAFPTALGQLQPALERNLHPLLWSPVATTVLALPTCLLAGLLGLSLMLLARPARRQIGYANRA